MAAREGRSTSGNSNGMFYGQLGTTGQRVSAIGLGGFHISVPKDEQEGIRIVRSALDRGYGG